MKIKPIQNGFLAVMLPAITFVLLSMAPVAKNSMNASAAATDAKSPTTSSTWQVPQTRRVTSAATAEPIGACGSTVLTQSADPKTLVSPHTPQCSDGFTDENSVARSFVMDTEMLVCGVQFGVQENDGGDHTVTVNIYSGDINGAYGDLLLRDSMAVTIADNTELQFISVVFDSPVHFVAGETMVVEIYSPNRNPNVGGDGGGFWPGSNGLGESAPSYIRAPACGAPDFTTFADIGFPGVHLALKVFATEASGEAVECLCLAGSLLEGACVSTWSQAKAEWNPIPPLPKQPGIVFTSANTMSGKNIWNGIDGVTIHNLAADATIQTIVTAIQNAAADAGGPINVLFHGHGSPGHFAFDHLGSFIPLDNEPGGNGLANKNKFIANINNTHVKSVTFFSCSTGASNGFLSKLAEGTGATIRGYTGPITARLDGEAAGSGVDGARQKGTERVVQPAASDCKPDLAPEGGDGVVDVSDLLVLLGQWGPCVDPAFCPADIAPESGDGVVDVSDLLVLLAGWGPCPEPPLLFGACCLGDDGCMMATASECAGVGGSFLGPDSTCSSTLCGPFPISFRFSQLHFDVDGVLAPFSNTGMLEVTFIGSSTMHYLNLGLPSTDPWVVQNMPLLAVDGAGILQTTSVWFPLNVPMGQPVAFLFCGMSATPVPMPGPPDFNIEAEVEAFDVIFSSGDAEIPVPVPAPEPFVYVPPRNPDREIKASNSDMINQPSGPRQCTPVAISNSLKWLKAKHGLDMADEDISIAKMKEAVEFDPDTGTSGAWWERKKQFMEDNDYPIETTWVPENGVVPWPPPAEGVPVPAEAIQEVVDRLNDDCDVELDYWGHTAVIVGITRNPQAPKVVSLDIMHDVQQRPKGEENEKGMIRQTITLNTETGRLSVGVATRHLKRFVIECKKEDDDGEK